MSQQTQDHQEWVNQQQAQAAADAELEFIQAMYDQPRNPVVQAKVDEITKAYGDAGRFCYLTGRVDMALERAERDQQKARDLAQATKPVLAETGRSNNV